MPRRKRPKRSLVIGDCGAIYGIPWDHLCSGEITDEIEGELNQFIVSDGEKFSLFNSLSKPKSWLMMIWEPDQTDYACKSLMLVSKDDFDCNQENNSAINLNYPNSRIKCMDHPFRSWHAVKDSCSLKRPRAVNFTTVIFTSDNYANERVWNHAQMSPSSSIIWIVLMLAIIWLRFIIRRR